MISQDVAARIKACEGLYSIGDTARFFNVSKSTVHSVWTRRTVSPSEAPNIKSSRVPKDILQEDARTLLGRGMTVPEVAAELGVHPSTVYRNLNRRNVGLYVTTT